MSEDKTAINAGYGKLAQNVPVTAEDIDVIRKALALYVEHRRREYHRAAAVADTEESLRLSLAYEADKEYIFRLLRKVGDGKLGAPATLNDQEAEQESRNE